MRTMRKAAAMVMAATMIIGVMSVSAFATEDTTAADESLAVDLVGDVAEETTVAEAETEDPMAAVSDFDPDGSFHARVGFQASKDTVWLTNKGYYFEDFVTIQSDSGTDTTIDNGTYTEIEVAGNGTYTATLVSPDLAGYTFQILQLATDVYKNDALTFDNVTATINGVQKAKFTGDTVFIDDDSANSSKDTVALTIYNNWRTGYDSDGIFPCDVMESLTGDITIEISFDVSGFNYDKAASETVAETSAEAVSNADTETVSAAAETEEAKYDANNTFIHKYWIVFVAITVVVIAAVVVLVIMNNNNKKKNA